MNSVELQKKSNDIADIWKKVGLELGLSPEKLNFIELNHPNHNAKASLDMLQHWQKVNTNASQEMLTQAIKECRDYEGIILLILCK